MPGHVGQLPGHLGEPCRGRILGPLSLFAGVLICFAAPRGRLGVGPLTGLLRFSVGPLAGLLRVGVSVFAGLIGLGHQLI